eukprot:CAMPEP_0118948736 /NCGR_PEP_ID=MMETSP1169-20130426/48330_1 /TAXON_ID=36882 /ORGANISM="Pyramimonas obovata, Strain CCMP722" /LENGTH=187 /DNA_ID=CAMNT_0006895237 /DNA_START=248 /DNA_END=808 /DNA_ORIENTATION=+
MGKRRLRDKAGSASESEPRVAADANVLPSIVKAPHFQRKITKRLEFNDKLKQLQQAAIAKKQSTGVSKRKRKGVGKALGSLAGLSECLDAVEVGGPNAADALKLNPKTLKSRARVQLLAKETERMGSVMAHPVYKADPIAAIRAHLEATVAATEHQAKAPKDSSGTTSEKRRRQQKKKGGGAKKGGG